jgi:hypothetical protein
MEGEHEIGCGGSIMLSGDGWMLIGGVLIAGFLVLVQLWRRADARAATWEAKATTREAKAKRLGTELSRESQARKRQAEELTALRKRADKSKRRKMKGFDQPLGTSARIRDHETEVERLRLERDRALSEKQALTDSLSELESELARSRRALEEATAPRSIPEPSTLEAALEESRSELASSLEKATKLEDGLELARETEVRMRKRMRNQEILYASLRAELDVKKDRLRTQEEQLQRLQALKVAVLD